MNPDKLVRMANQIGAFFDTDPDQEAAVREIANHLKRFWDPAMRTEIIRYAASGGEGLRDSVRCALESLACAPRTNDAAPRPPR